MTITRRDLLRAGLGSLAPANGPREAEPPEPAESLPALADEHASIVEGLRRLLASPLDTDDIPGFAALDDRRAAIVARLADIPARTAADLLAKARVLVIRAAMVGDDCGDPLARSLAADVVALAGGDTPVDGETITETGRPRPSFRR